jgi:uncharacterized membrane protein
MRIKGVRRYFITGIATILPLLLTFWFLRWIYLKIDSLLFQPLLSLMENWIRYPGVKYLAKFSILLIVFLGITFIGFLASFLFFRRMFAKFESLLLRFPFVGKVYKSIKQISIAIVGEGKNIFKKVVLVEYPHPGKFCIGFLTADADEKLNKASNTDLVGVFIPTTPNPTSGMLIYFPRDAVKVLDISVEEGMRLVISAGTAQLGNVREE